MIESLGGVANVPVTPDWDAEDAFRGVLSSPGVAKSRGSTLADIRRLIQAARFATLAATIATGPRSTPVFGQKLALANSCGTPPRAPYHGSPSCASARCRCGWR